jgi:hypothetical protein
MAWPSRRRTSWRAFASSNEFHHEPFRRQRRDALQLAAQRAQSRADWYFESIDDDSATPGGSADDFVANSKNGGAQAMITIPMIGWMPKLGANPRQARQLFHRQIRPANRQRPSWMPDAGNGISVTNDTAITNNDPTDANFPTNSAFQQAYVQHLINRWGASTNGGVRYYLMDNEHSIWFSTHQDVHPVGPTMQEIRDKILDYAGMVKSNDPNALVLRAGGMGLVRYFLQRLRQQWSAIRATPTGPPTAAGITCPGC